MKLRGIDLEKQCSDTHELKRNKRTEIKEEEKRKRHCKKSNKGRTVFEFSINLSTLKICVVRLDYY